MKIFTVYIQKIAQPLSHQSLPDTPLKKFSPRVLVKTKNENSPLPHPRPQIPPRQALTTYGIMSASHGWPIRLDAALPPPAVPGGVRAIPLIIAVLEEEHRPHGSHGTQISAPAGHEDGRRQSHA